MGNFSNKSTETTLHKICVQVFLRFSDSSKSSQYVSLIYELVWLAGFRKSEENLLKTSWNVVPVIKVAHIFWWRHDNRKQSASAREHWCDVSCDFPYYMGPVELPWARNKRKLQNEKFLSIVGFEPMPGSPSLQVNHLIHVARSWLLWVRNLKSSPSTLFMPLEWN